MEFGLKQLVGADYIRRCIMHIAMYHDSVSELFRCL